MAGLQVIGNPLRVLGAGSGVRQVPGCRENPSTGSHRLHDEAIAVGREGVVEQPEELVDLLVVGSDDGVEHLAQEPEENVVRSVQEVEAAVVVNPIVSPVIEVLPVQDDVAEHVARPVIVRRQLAQVEYPRQEIGL